MSVHDIRRDLSSEIYQFMLSSFDGPEIKKGFEISVPAAYTKDELDKILGSIGFNKVQVSLTHPDL